MAHHLTPSELADQLQMKRQEVIGKCSRWGPDLPRPHRQDLFESSLRSYAPRQRSVSHRVELS